MNVQEALRNPGSAGYTLGPVTVREAGTRLQEPSKFKAGLMNWKQKITVADSTGETGVYLTDQPPVLVGQTIEIQGASTAKTGKYCNGNYKAVIKQVASIQRGSTEPVQAMSDESDPLLLENVPFDTKAARMADTWQKIRHALQEATGIKIISVSDLDADSNGSYAQALATQNQAMIAACNTIFINMAKGL